MTDTDARPGGRGENARPAAGRTAERLAGEQLSAPASLLGDLGAAAHGAADTLEARDRLLAARLVREAAAGLDQASATLRERDLAGLAHEVARFARRQPVAFLAGAALAGVAITRLARAAAPAGRGFAARGPVSASVRSLESSIPSNGLNRSDPEGVPLSRAGSSALAASAPLPGVQREGAPIS